MINCSLSSPSQPCNCLWDLYYSQVIIDSNSSLNNSKITCDRPLVLDPDCKVDCVRVETKFYSIQFCYKNQLSRGSCYRFWRRNPRNKKFKDFFDKRVCKKTLDISFVELILYFWLFGGRDAGWYGRLWRDFQNAIRQAWSEHQFLLPLSVELYWLRSLSQN